MDGDVRQTEVRRIVQLKKERRQNWIATTSMKEEEIVSVPTKTPSGFHRQNKSIKRTAYTSAGNTDELNARNDTAVFNGISAPPQLAAALFQRDPTLGSSLGLEGGVDAYAVSHDGGDLSFSPIEPMENSDPHSFVPHEMKQPDFCPGFQIDLLNSARI
mmetsp:Transcript_11589/g.26437  ORF Transcript_11589/g.26437 Transcript_11589/m.26437 type:complete len:159 (+) Transcript_11589:87-563(+)